MAVPPNGKLILSVFLIFFQLCLAACDEPERPDQGTPAVPAAFSPTFDDETADTLDDSQPESTLTPLPRPTGTTGPTPRTALGRL